MKISAKPAISILLFILGLILTPLVSAQDFREEFKLIRPKPGHTRLMGKISMPAEESRRQTEVSLFDPQLLRIEESILADDFSYYLFTVKTGKTYGLIIETEGFFPYYSLVIVPDQPADDVVNHHINLGDHLRNRYHLYFTPLDTILGTHSGNALQQIIRLLTNQLDMLVWFNPQGDSLDPVRINQLSSEMVMNGIDASRIMAGPRPEQNGKLIELILKTGVDSAYIPEIRLQHELGSDSWTIQFMASRKEVEESAFKGLDPVFVFRGKDGYFRYTYGDYKTSNAAESALRQVRAKGFRQSFVKKASELSKL